jgi:hypothetical protein
MEGSPKTTAAMAVSDRSEGVKEDDNLEPQTAGGKRDEKEKLCDRSCSDPILAFGRTNPYKRPGWSTDHTTTIFPYDNLSWPD